MNYYKYYDKYLSPRKLNKEFVKLIQYGNKGFNPDKTKQSILYRLKDYYFRNFKYPLFKNKIKSITKKNLIKIDGMKNANAASYAVSQYLATILEYCKTYNLDLYEDVLSKIFTETKVDIQFEYDSSTIYDILKSYSITYSFISEYDHYYKDCMVVINFKDNIQDKLSELSVRIFETAEDNKTVLSKNYHHFKIYEIPESGIIENPNYSYDKSIRKEEMNEVKTLFSMIIVILTIIIDAMFTLKELEPKT